MNNVANLEVVHVGERDIIFAKLRCWKAGQLEGGQRVWEVAESYCTQPTVVFSKKALKRIVSMEDQFCADVLSTKTQKARVWRVFIVVVVVYNDGWEGLTTTCAVWLTGLW
jgi:hypothetical protein